ncbi:hypothetical protein COY95_03705 [Candidatus Woesearchaeota archaeon CG_4_10_14_0_8_um_filter_47_5]|nr:MAG: hypothetical protein COY95_03705 [Candidatus Woesearchaeota archaeon CG_4_10_14_0_8_um_filter_47_5]
MKKHLSSLILFVAILTLSLSLAVSAVERPALLQNRTPGQALGETISVDNVKQALTNAIDRVIQHLDVTRARVEASMLDPEEKQALLDQLDSMEQHLADSKIQVEEAESIEEIRQLFTDVKDYIIENQDELRAIYKEKAQKVAEKAVAKLEEIQQSIEALLKTLKLACPNNREDVNQIEALLARLQSQTAEIKALAAQGAGQQELKAATQAAVATVKEIKQLALKVKAECPALQQAPPAPPEAPETPGTPE